MRARFVALIALWGLLGLFPGVSQAQTVAPQYTCDGTTGVYDSASACAAAGLSTTCSASCTLQTDVITEQVGVCGGVWCAAGYYPTYSTTLQIGGNPEHWTGACPSGYNGGGTPENMTCTLPGTGGGGGTSPSCPPAGTYDRAVVQIATDPTNGCDAGCGVSGTPDGSSFKCADGLPCIEIQEYYTGQTCTPGPANPAPTPAPPNAPPDPTPGAPQSVPPAEANCISSGGSWGSVNGTDQCLPAGSQGSQQNTSAPTSTTTTTQNPDGSTTTTTTTTQQQTTCDQTGNCTTSTTTSTASNSCPAGTAPPAKASKTPPAGCTSAPGNGSSSTSSGTQACPSGQNCSGDTWAGSCGAGFSCDGDAVECAISQAAWVQACLDQPDQAVGISKSSGEGILSSPHTGTGASSASTSQYVESKTQDLSTTFSGSQGAAPGACPADQVIPLGSVFGGASISIGISQSCNFWQLAGQLSFAAVALGCAVFLVRGV